MTIRKTRTVHINFDADETAALDRRQGELAEQGVRIPLSTIVRGIVAQNLGVARRAGLKRARPRSARP